MEGTSIGPYRIIRKLGEGGMGAVWLGEHTLLGRRAAIKVLLPAYSANEGIVQRFFNEARAVTAIADPGIVQVFDFGEHTDGSAFLVMELLEGEAMDARLRRIGRFSPIDALRLVRQVATSLGAAHAKGVIHRDLKPENIFIVGDPAVTGGERPKVLDFGIAKLANDEPGQMKTRTGVLMGTPVYMSPEQCRGATSIDHRSDIYALGCVLFTMLVGRPPFEGEGSGDIIIAHVRDAPPTPSALVGGLTPTLDALVLRCLAKAPDARFQTMAEFVAAIGATESSYYGYPADRGSQQMAAMAAAQSYPGAMTPSPHAGSYPGAMTPMPHAGSYPGAMTPATGPTQLAGYGSAPSHGSYPGVTTPAPYAGAATPAPYAGAMTPAPYAGAPASHPGTQPPMQAPAVTTLSAASGDASPAMRPRRTGLVVAGVAVVGLAAGAVFMLGGGGSGGGGGTSDPATSAGTGAAAVTVVDAGASITIEPVDATALATTADAGVAADAAEVATEAAPVDAGKQPDRGTRGGSRRGNSNGTKSGSGLMDRGD